MWTPNWLHQTKLVSSSKSRYWCLQAETFPRVIIYSKLLHCVILPGCCILMANLLPLQIADSRVLLKARVRLGKTMLEPWYCRRLYLRPQFCGYDQHGLGPMALFLESLVTLSAIYALYKLWQLWHYKGGSNLQWGYCEELRTAPLVLDVQLLEGKKMMGRERMRIKNKAETCRWNMQDV